MTEEQHDLLVQAIRASIERERELHERILELENLVLSLEAQREGWPDPIPADNEAETVRIGAWYELEIPLPLVRHFGGQTLMIRPSNITIHRRRFGLTVDGEIDFDAIVRPRRD